MPAKLIEFFDRSAPDTDESLLVVERGSLTPSNDPTIGFQVKYKSKAGSEARLNYAQALRLRDFLNGWLSRNFGVGSPLWNEEER